MSIELEVRALYMDEDGVHWCHEKNAQFFSVYAGKPGSFMCLGDCETADEALAWARSLSEEWEVPMFDRIER